MLLPTFAAIVLNESSDMNVNKMPLSRPSCGGFCWLHPARSGSSPMWSRTSADAGRAVGIVRAVQLACRMGSFSRRHFNEPQTDAK